MLVLGWLHVKRNSCLVSYPNFYTPQDFQVKCLQNHLKKNSFKAKKHFQEKNHFKKIIQRKRFKQELIYSWSENKMNM
jgi:hypothetical protein